MVRVEIGKLLDELREEAVKVNKEYASKIGIPVAAAITCVKPSGTVSQLVDAVLVFTQDTIHFTLELLEEIRKTH